MHTPVLADEVIEALQIAPGKKYIDATVGEGGHLARILEKGGQVLAIDWDSTQVSSLESQVSSQKVQFAVGNFAQIAEIAESYHFLPVDGILFDLGLSMRQINEGNRGFSFKKLEDPLDMRIGQAEVTAQEIVNTYDEEELYEVFARYSEERYSKEVAKAIVWARKKRPLKTVGDLMEAFEKALNGKPFNRARLFQALRIAVNREFENLRSGLEQATGLLNPGGRLVVITFHSLEDRIVKQMIGGKVIKARSEASFERSAKVRVFTKS